MVSVQHAIPMWHFVSFVAASRKKFTLFFCSAPESYHPFWRILCVKINACNFTRKVISVDSETLKGGRDTNNTLKICDADCWIKLTKTFSGVFRGLWNGNIGQKWVKEIYEFLSWCQDTNLEMLYLWHGFCCS